MARALIVPAAGAGTRLGGTTPKLLHPVNGRPMIEHLLDLYQPVVDRFVIVVSPGAASPVGELVRLRQSVDLEIQSVPTGMLDAILIPLARVCSSAWTRIWITWCDQVAVHPATIRALLAREDAEGGPLVFPTARGRSPYIHLVRDATGRIVRILHRREGDPMPAVGESDIGLFSLSRAAYCDLLPAFARQVAPGSATGERNFLPFIPWAAARAGVETFPCTEAVEALGINTPDDLRQVEAHLRGRRNPS